MHGTLNLQMSLPFFNNFQFLATKSGFTKAVRELQFYDIPISQFSLRSPVSTSESFRLTVDNVIAVLMGTPTNTESKKKATTLSKKVSRIYGKPLRPFGFTEEQPRGLLHINALYWGGITPALL